MAAKETVVKATAATTKIANVTMGNGGDGGDSNGYGDGDGEGDGDGDKNNNQTTINKTRQQKKWW